MRYLGKLTNLYPEDPSLSLCVDEVIDTIIDFTVGIDRVDRSDNAAYERDLIAYLEENIPRYLGGLERRIETFGNGPWAVGPAITTADLAIYMIFLNARAGAWDYFDASSLDTYPRLSQIAEQVLRHPNVAEWNASIAEKAAAVKRKREVR